MSEPLPQREVRYESSVARWPVRAFNATAGSLERCGVRLADLEADVLCAAARRKTGLDDLGNDDFREPLALLIRSLETEADLHPFGRSRARQLIMSGLVNRLRLESDWKRWPEILDERLERPLFILGLPRTGTTLLFNLLACDGRHRWLSFWEAHTPSPPPDRATRDNDPRRRTARRHLRVLDHLLPDLAAIHEFGVDLPEECYPLLANSFAGVQYSWGFFVPGYDEWLTRCDMHTVYRYYRRQLQLLQWHCRGERWLLKSPVHLHYLDALLAAFPDACIVQLHRDPLEVLPSACSLRATLRSMVMRRVDVHRLSEQLVQESLGDILRAIAVRRELGSGRFFDLGYRELVRDPLGAVRRIYERFGDELSPQAETAMSTYLATHPQNRHGRHLYSLEQFGLDAGSVRRLFEPYAAEFAGVLQSGDTAPQVGPATGRQGTTLP
ncbi:MAG: sulfotransferase [Deltaproteobacteria bacterium]|nr:sulfotransferase [Deltaproteobacteria bacterium]